MSEATLFDKLIKLFLVCTPVELILNGEIDETKIPKDRLVDLLRCYCQEYSDTEAGLISQYYLNNTKGHNVYLSLNQAARELLSVRSNQIRCRYEHILRWRGLTREVGEDILVCAFLVDDFRQNHRTWTNFTWNIVLGHDNKQLNALMSDGISDNHFHLFGSAPVFPMIWIRMMNDVHHGKYLAGLMGIDKNRRHFQYNLSGVKECLTSQTLILQAALMRAVMFYALQRRDFYTENQRTVCDFLQLLKSGKNIAYGRKEIGDLIQKLKLMTMMSDGSMQSDYTLNGIREPEDYSNWLFSGERKLIYDMLCDILVTNKLPEQIQKLLYPYLVIRTWFRKELVLSNDNIGFENFSVYNKRKGYFLPVYPTAKEKRIYWQTKERDQNLKWMVQHAVLESFRLQNLKSLEIRIVPEDDFAANIRQIETYDRLLLKQNELEDRAVFSCSKQERGILSLDQFYYVYHFAKSKDEKSVNEFVVKCRHSRLRSRLKKQAEAIIKMRRLRPEVARRVRGIDACSMEIGCRPEVFACIFHKLRMDVPFALGEEARKYIIAEHFGRDEDITGQSEYIPQLSITYHVGEDFLDPVDGLRALDEAIRFLEMRSGDRFGHATVLGLDLQEWYHRKDYCIHLKEQDYLDNVMWFYMMIMEFHIEDCELLKDYLYKEFLEAFHHIYVENRSRAEISDTREQTNIFQYFESWKLRGNPPDDYKERTEDDIKCKDPWISNLYYRYHFDQKARELGDRVIEKRIPKMYIDGVLKLQRCMQERIAQKGIGIEINPSSNLAISTMKTYADHPILNLYSLGLGDKRNIPQMFVSINTDDRGVFQTSLENEYALLAASVENLTDENGEKLYTPQAVYEWLNHIRIMGNQQVF